jgi:hypothetical protein
VLQLDLGGSGATGLFRKAKTDECEIERDLAAGV